MKRKSQITSQVFIYILAALIGGIILIVGYKAIAAIMEAARESTITDIENKMTNTVSTVARQTGTNKKYEFSLPGEYDRICYVDSRGEDGRFASAVRNNAGLSQPDNILIKDSVAIDGEPNVFLMKKRTIGKSFYMEDLDVDGDFLCIENQGLITVWLRGIGKKALLYLQDEN